MSPAKWLSESQVVCNRLAVSLSHTTADAKVESLLPWLMGSPVKIGGRKTAGGAVVLMVTVGDDILRRTRVVANRPDQSKIRRAAMVLVEKTIGEYCFSRSF